MHDLMAMRVFVTVAETQSFAAAARRLRLSTSVVSHHVAKLEGMLGVPLLNRSTRRVGLTEDGAQYFRRAKPLVDEADALFRETREQAPDVSGRLKLAVPPGIAEHLILPPTLDFIREHPRLDVVFDVDPRQTDVIADGYDVAIRSGALVGPGLKSRRLADIHFRLCTTPVYIDRHGVPKNVEDLANHHIAHWYVPTGQAPWQFETADGPAEIAVTGPIATNSLHGQFIAVRSGLAMAALPDSLVQTCLESGEFVEVLAGAKTTPTPLWILWPERAFEAPKIRRYVDHLVASLNEHK